MNDKVFKKILSILKEFTDKKCPKIELRYVFYDAKNKLLVSTDTIRLLAIEYDLNYEENLFIDINNEGIGVNPIVINNQIAYKEDTIGKFPKYENIFIKDGELKKANNDLSIATNLLNIGSLTNKNIIINYSKKYNKLDIGQENLYLITKEPIEPVMLQGLMKIDKYKFSFKLVVMPINLNKE